MADYLIPPHLRTGEVIPALRPSQVYVTPQLADFTVPREFWRDIITQRDGRSVAINEHHIYYYGAAYTTRLAKDFRALPQNRTVLTVTAHNYYHENFIPPVKPPTVVMAETMLDALGLQGKHGRRFLRRRYGLEPS